MSEFHQLAIIGSTASGKTNLSLQLADKLDAHILSLDSLAIYKEINIASAKPSLDERAGIKHFGVDVMFPNEHFDVTTFIQLYHAAKEACITEKKNLIIVGGTSFYLDMLLKGVSSVPKISNETKIKTAECLLNVQEAYKFLFNIDQEHMKNINKNDHYRIEKMLNLYFETTLSPTEYFKQNLPQPTISKSVKLPIYEIAVDRDILLKRIHKRTREMTDNGLIDEVFYLEKHYTRQANSMKSIGIKEVLRYLDGYYTKKEMQERISIHTAQLAKRQHTYNNTKFENKVSLPLKELENLLL